MSFLFLCLSFFFLSFWQKTEEQAGAAGTSAQGKKRKKEREKTEEKKTKAQMVPNIVRASMTKSFEMEYSGIVQLSL